MNGGEIHLVRAVRPPKPLGKNASNEWNVRKEVGEKNKRKASLHNSVWLLSSKKKKGAGMS